MNATIKNIISYFIIASIFITGEGLANFGFRVYWYYPFYFLFVAYGALVYRKIDIRIFSVVLSVFIYSLATYETGLPLVVKQIFNVGFSAIVFYFFILHENSDLTAIFEKYIAFCKLVLVLGFAQVILFTVGWDELFLTPFGWLRSYPVSTRMQSITQEPSYIAFTFAPVVFLALHNIFYRTSYFLTRRWSMLFVIGYLLTVSSLAFIGALGMLVLLYFKNFTYTKLALVFFALAGMFLLGYIGYSTIKDFKERVDDTAKGLTTDFFVNNNYRQVNLSTFSFLVNYNVTRLAFPENPVFGHGLGTHELVYDRHTPDDLKAFRFYTMNRQDASSMAFRLLTEMGLVGLSMFCLFVYHYKLKSSYTMSDEMEWLWILNSGIFILIALALFRNGNYTIHGKILFFFLYYYSYRQAKSLAVSLESNEA